MNDERRQLAQLERSGSDRVFHDPATMSFDDFTRHSALEPGDELMHKARAGTFQLELQRVSISVRAGLRSHGRNRTVIYPWRGSLRRRASPLICSSSKSAHCGLLVVGSAKRLKE